MKDSVFTETSRQHKSQICLLTGFSHNHARENNLIGFVYLDTMFGIQTLNMLTRYFRIIPEVPTHIQVLSGRRDRP